jgi:hypothetical protein
VGCSERGDELWGFIRGREFLDQLAVNFSRTVPHCVSPTRHVLLLRLFAEHPVLSAVLLLRYASTNHCGNTTAFFKKEIKCTWKHSKKRIRVLEDHVSASFDYGVEAA